MWMRDQSLFQLDSLSWCLLRQSDIIVPYLTRLLRFLEARDVFFWIARLGRTFYRFLPWQLEILLELHNLLPCLRYCTTDNRTLLCWLQCSQCLQSSFSRSCGWRCRMGKAFLGREFCITSRNGCVLLTSLFPMKVKPKTAKKPGGACQVRSIAHRNLTETITYQYITLLDRTQNSLSLKISLLS